MDPRPLRFGVRWGPPIILSAESVLAGRRRRAIRNWGSFRLSIEGGGVI
jgi:hypothetical protein